MNSPNFRKHLYASALLVLIGSTAHAATLYVNCGARSGGGAYSSIGAALKALKGSEGGGANTINVTGACYENVLIADAIQLTITGTNGASITDLSGDRADVLDIRNSRVTITGMTIDAKSGVYWDAVDCEQGSHCTLVGNTIQGGADAVGVYTTASAIITGGAQFFCAGVDLRAAAVSCQNLDDVVCGTKQDMTFDFHHASTHAGEKADHLRPAQAGIEAQVADLDVGEDLVRASPDADGAAFRNRRSVRIVDVPLTGY